MRYFIIKEDNVAPIQLFSRYQFFISYFITTRTVWDELSKRIGEYLKYNLCYRIFESRSLRCNQVTYHCQFGRLGTRKLTYCHRNWIVIIWQCISVNLMSAIGKKKQHLAFLSQNEGSRCLSPLHQSRWNAPFGE